MADTKPLDAGQKHMLRLIAKEAGADGWAPASAPIFRLLKDGMPSQLIELESVGDAGRGRARLTEAGANLLDAMAWL